MSQKSSIRKTYTKKEKDKTSVSFVEQKEDVKEEEKKVEQVPDGEGIALTLEWIL